MTIRRHLLSYLTPRVAVPVALLGLAAFAPSCKDKPAENAVDAAVATTPVASSVAPLASAPPATSASAAASGHAEGDRHGGGGAHGGPAAMLFQAARATDLKPEQKTKVEAAEKTAHEGASDSSREAMKEAGKGLHTELIAGIKAGKIDNAKLEPKYAALEKLATASHDKESEALTSLHDALDAPQRKAVVADVRAKLAAREEKMAHREGKDDAGAPDGGKGLSMGKRQLDRLTRGLDLDADQQKKVDALAPKDDGKGGGRPDMAEMKKSMDNLLTEFEKDKFDAKKATTIDPKKMRAPMEAETKLLSGLVPILKPEQREKLATKMEKGPSPHGRRGGFGHGPLMEDDDQPAED